MRTKLAEHKARDKAALGAKNEKLRAKRLTSKELLLNEENLLKKSLKSCTQLLRDLETRSEDLESTQEALGKFDSKWAKLTSNHQVPK